MRHIGDLDTPKQAEAFLSWLLVNGIVGQPDATEQGVEIWIKEEDQFQQAIREFKLFRDNPDDPKYANSVAQARNIIREEEKRKQEIQKRIISPAQGGRLQGKPARLTIGLLIACIVVALLSNFGAGNPDNFINRAFQYTCITFESPKEAIMFALQQDPDSFESRTLSLRRGEIWRLVTPIFIHFGVPHILFNMYWLVILGSVIEKRYGILNYGLLILAIAIISNFVQCTVPEGIGGSAPGIIPNGSSYMTLLGGMSGVGYGLFGFVWMKSTYDPSSGIRINNQTIAIMLIWLVLCMAGPIMQFLSMNVANWAHGIGLLVGVIVGYVTSPVYSGKS